VCVRVHVCLCPYLCLCLCLRVRASVCVYMCLLSICVSVSVCEVVFCVWCDAVRSGSVCVCVCVCMLSACARHMTLVCPPRPPQACWWWAVCGQSFHPPPEGSPPGHDGPVLAHPFGILGNTLRARAGSPTVGATCRNECIPQACSQGPATGPESWLGARSSLALACTPLLVAQPCVRQRRPRCRLSISTALCPEHCHSRRSHKRWVQRRQHHNLPGCSQRSCMVCWTEGAPVGSATSPCPIVHTTQLAKGASHTRGH
jgi:hypothetical protein